MNESVLSALLTLGVVVLLGLVLWGQRLQKEAREEFFATRDNYRRPLTLLKNAAQKYPPELRTRADHAIERIEEKFALFMALTRRDAATDWRSALKSLKTLAFSARGLHDIYEEEYKKTL